MTSKTQSSLQMCTTYVDPLLPYVLRRQDCYTWKHALGYLVSTPDFHQDFFFLVSIAIGSSKVKVYILAKRPIRPALPRPGCDASPGFRFSKATEFFRARKAMAKSRALRLQSCSIHILLIWTEVAFIQEVSDVYTSLFLDTDELKMAL